MLDFSIRRIVPRPRPIPRTGDNSPASSLYAYVWRMSGGHQIWVGLLGAIVAALAFLPLELQRRIIDDALPGGSAQEVVTLGSFFLLLILGQSALKFGLRLAQAWLSESAIRYTRTHLATVYAWNVHGSPDGEETVPTKLNTAGKSVSIISAETDKLGSFVGEAIVAPLMNAGILIALFAYMLIVEPAIALVSAVFLLPQLILTPLLQRRINRLTERRLERLRELGEIVAGKPTPEDVTDNDTFSTNLDRIFRNRIQIAIWKFTLKGLVNLCNHLATLCVLVLGSWLVLAGETTIGVVVAFITGFERISDPMRQLLSFYRAAQLAAVQHRMIAAILPERKLSE
ncbi:MAG: ABC transporter transmembrane domain-containing protein [Pseudomonadota bacterium]